jgi:hypothetical protein
MEDVFAVSMGGSGSAVANALIFLTSAGVFEDKVENIHLLIIDAHESNKTTMAARENAKEYTELKKHFNPTNGYSSFKPTIHHYFWNLMVSYSGTRTKRDKFSLKDLTRIDRSGADLDEYDDTTRTAEMLMQSLYTEHEQEQAVLTGYHAHPSIGAACGTAAVLSDNDVTEGGYGTFVKTLQSKLALGDIKLALVGSLFGGTGASSLSSIVRALYKAGNQPGLTGKLSIAGFFLLKYFAFKKPEDKISKEKEIRTEMFDFGSKNALTYYNESGLLKKTGDDEDGMFDAIYMLGFDKPIERAPYSDGDGMDNPASFVEMEAAMAMRDFFIDRKIERGDLNRTFFKAIRKYIQEGQEYYRLEWDSLTNGIRLREWLGKALKMALIFNMYMYPIIFLQSGGVRKQAFQPYECYIEGNGEAMTECERLRKFYFRLERWSLQVAETLGSDVTKSRLFDLVQFKELVNFQSNDENKSKEKESTELLKKYDAKNYESFVQGYTSNNFVKLSGILQNKSKPVQDNKLAELLELIYTNTELEV